ncbi:hypothetical protein DM860_003176 [Cuscuta australis]|uniref:UBP-type domain-containing protein n=1 Tax=Cuscuta australis TaxID=267555 RepID=A0A328D6U2_9ASTE|nr:hypothetical protein DM860_003176 [Cuscuta australis]
MASSSVPVVIYEEEELVMDDGSGSGWVEPRTSCDHLASLSQDLAHIPHPATPCSKCQHPMENWLCLSCKQVFCSRFVNKHMVDHHEQTPNHSVALSFSDLSVWCFVCNAYLDAQAIRALHIVHQTAYLLKFGEDPPQLPSNDQCLQLGNE